MILNPESPHFETFNSKKGRYFVKSKHIGDSGDPVFINELIESTSPYLLQHAHNPVEWKQWSPGAFEQARQANKPVFLSIGYATCHWCHVMEKESFEDTEVAAFLNRHFVAIKVDREQHPVVDDFYMTSVQLIQGQGGWPLSAFLLPDGSPFVAATYFPKDRFLSVLQQIQHLWQTQPDQLKTQGQRVHATVSRYLSGQNSEALVNWGEATPALSDELMAMRDQSTGGFGSAPKFPQEAWLQFLLYHHLDSQDEDAGRHLVYSLKKMQGAGIWDWVAGGFHRYAVDGDWLVPHFEKMLYNQAQLLLIYAQAALVFDEPDLAETAKNVAAFVKAEMQDDRGLFYAALDADSNDDQGISKEGAYYVWSWPEWHALLNEDEISWLHDHFDVQERGNFEGHHILHLKQPFADQGKWRLIQEKLRLGRMSKARPITDDKIILSWNAMMIEALAWSGHLLADDSMQQQALKALESITETHCDRDRWYRVGFSSDGQNIPAVLSDLANLAAAMWAVHETGLKEMRQPLEDLLVTIKKDFWRHGRLVKAPADQQLPVVVNAKDGAVVSATAKILMVLSAIQSGEWSSWRDDILNSLGNTVTEQNTAHAGIHTAQLMAKNHVLGQRSLSRKGMSLTWEFKEDVWSLSLQCPKNWHWQSVQCKVDGTDMNVKNQNSELLLPPHAKTVVIIWQPCDDQQCWPPQEAKIHLI